MPQIDVPFGKSVRAAFSFADAAGNAAKVDGMPVVTSTLGSVTVEATDTGFAAILTIGAVGTATLSGTADADTGEGVKPLGFSFRDPSGEEYVFNGLASPEADHVVVEAPSII